MNLRSLTNRVRATIEKRGGTDALKEDAEELRNIARRRGSTTDKLKEGVEAIEDPGAPGPERRERADQGEQPEQPATPPARDTSS